MSNLPTTDMGWCEHFKNLDVEYGTDRRSPLHHDNRCPIHYSPRNSQNGQGMNWYRVTFKASSIRYASSAIIRMNIRAISPKDAINRIGNNDLRIPLGHSFETWSVKAAYKLKDQESARFIPVTQMQKDGSAPLRYVASWEWV